MTEQHVTRSLDELVLAKYFEEQDVGPHCEWPNNGAPLTVARKGRRGRRGKITEPTTICTYCKKKPPLEGGRRCGICKEKTAKYQRAYWGKLGMPSKRKKRRSDES